MGQVEWAMLQSLVGLSENEELEFKSQMWPRNRNEELARDIAQFAGNRGGLIIVGAREADGKLEELIPLQISESDELRIQQIVDSRISPRPTIHMRRVAANSQNAATAGHILLISVPDSRLKPHAVQEGNRLSYPIRTGSQKRYLSEPEVADHYVLRLKNHEETQRNLDALLESATSEISKPESPRTALVCAAVPEQPGQSELRSDTARKIQAYTLASFVPQAEWNLSTARTDFRSVCFGPETGSLVSLKFCVDGSGFALEPLDSDESDDLYAERVAISALNCLSLFGRHAVESEAAGSLSVAFRIVGEPGREVGLRIAATFGGRRWRTTRLPTVTARRDFSAEALAAGGRELLNAWEQVATDLMSPFDFASPIPRNDAGELNLNSYLRHWRGDFERLRIPAERA
ncbi:helix-turn-helix domain-containing protein [Candidatus Poriferisodalis sp.]|uniref:AlbA family DNA-binding domain-containing protein n=1 Tax=Candidatus Poriferisodalis sp. TaxID=3101277 RepID=UPI003B51EF85